MCEGSHLSGNISYVSGDDRAALGAWLCSRKLLFDEQVMAEAMAPPYGDTFLAELVELAPWPANVWIAGRLGDLRGEAGTTVLRRLAGSTGPHTVTCVVFRSSRPAKPCGEQATPWLAEALGAAGRRREGVRHHRPSRCRRRPGLGPGGRTSRQDRTQGFVQHSVRGAHGGRVPGRTRRR